MLHRIYLPNYGDKMRRILKFQFRILEFACDPSIQLPLTRTHIQERFPEEAEWLSRKLFGRNGAENAIENEFIKGLETLIKYIKSSQSDGHNIIESFKHDITFEDHLNDPSFRFCYLVLLDVGAREAVKPLMRVFYKLFSTGYPPCICGHPSNFDRNALIAAFYEANPELGVCPACDDKRPDRIESKCSADEDHFFPQSKYPFISIHPANLVPLCKACNQTFKNVIDPIDNHENAPLVNTFHPYGRPAIDFIDVIFYRTSNEGARKIKIKDKDGAHLIRVKKLIQIFALDTRWQYRSDLSIKSIMNLIRDFGNGYRQAGVIETIDLRKELDRMMNSERKEIGHFPERILRTNYLRFALDDEIEFKIISDLFYDRTMNDRF
jgi:hypothetical protein